MSDLGVPRTGPITSLPRSPGPLGLAVSAFWADRRRTLPDATLLTCAAVGVAGSALVIGHRPGLGIAVIGAAVWAPTAVILARRRAVGDLVTVLLAVALVAVVAVRDAGWLVALCLATALVVAAAGAGSARSAGAVLLSGVTWVAGAVRVLPGVAQVAGSLAGTRRRQVLVATRSLAITVLLLVVFGLLFASADRVFASYLPRVDLDLAPARVVIGILVALVAATSAHLAMATPAWATLGARTASPARRGEWLLPVGALAAMILAFVLVQVGALLGGHRHVLRTAGLSYAEYAREGFAQLMAVTALTLLVVGVAARRAPRESARDRLVSRLALGALCLGTLGVVASALRRMDLYVEAFGLTRLRVFAVLVEVVLAAVLILVVVAGIRWRGGWLPRAVVQVVAVAMLGLAVANPDALILRHNAAADLEAGVDVFYLQGLSADAVPAMDLLDEPLRSCVLERVDVGPERSPAAWNLARERARESLGSGRTIDSADGSACSELLATVR